MPRESIEVEGIRIDFEHAGAGIPLVLLHGGLSDHREWRRQIDGLSDAFFVVAWDAPGSGGSSDPPPSFRMPDYADRLTAFIELLGLERPHVAGLSWGSTLALELWHRAPAIPRTLILASPYAGWAGSLPPAVVAERLERGLRDLEGEPEDYVRGWIPSLFSPEAPTAMIEETVAIMREFHPAGARVMLHSMAEADLRSVLPGIGVPTLLLVGDADVRSPLPVARALQTQIPGSTLAVIRGAGHQCNIEAADAFNDEVRRFLLPEPRR